jgi:hypothetical protein
MMWQKGHLIRSRDGYNSADRGRVCPLAHLSCTPWQRIARLLRR